MATHPRAPALIEPVTVDITEAARLSGLSRRRLQELLASEQIAYRYAASKRLVVWRWPAGKCPTPGSPPALSEWLVELPDSKPAA